VNEEFSSRTDAGGTQGHVVLLFRCLLGASKSALSARERAIAAPLAIDSQTRPLCRFNRRSTVPLEKTSTSAAVCPSPGAAHETPATME
ncbi:MAG: hypothetical protein VX911_06645, partial [Candidatus Latescibacterota bacterium]|nr:hypothetical protein [Candidatus Latescibacterota bacterium]